MLLPLQYVLCLPAPNTNHFLDPGLRAEDPWRGAPGCSAPSVLRPGPPPPRHPRARRSGQTCEQRELRHLRPRPCGGEERRKRRTGKFVPRTPWTREQWRGGAGGGVTRREMEGGGDRKPSAGTESDPGEEETACRSVSLLLRSRVRAREGGNEGETNSPRGRRRRREKAGKERETESEGRAASRLRGEKEQKGLRDSALESRGGHSRSPGRIRRPSEVLGCPHRSPRPQKPAGLGCAA